MLRASIAIGIALVALATPARATLQISWDFGSATGGCIDNAACDQSPLIGTLQLANQLINGVAVNGSIQTSTKSSGLNVLNTSSLSVINTNAISTAATVTVGDTDFIGPVDAFSTSGAGTWQGAVGSTATLNWFNDARNSQGAESATDTPGILIDTFTSTPTLFADSFSHNGSGPATDPGLFSMTEQITGLLTPGATLLNRGQTEIKTATPIREPGSAALLGTALLGMQVLRRSMRRR